MLRQLRWALLWALVILVLCLIPGAALPQWHWFALFNLDKSVHAGMFFILASLFAQAFRDRGSPRRYLMWAVLISAAYGVSTELMQGLEALGRRTDINDMIANAIGALLASLYASWCVRREKPIVPLAFLR